MKAGAINHNYVNKKNKNSSLELKRILDDQERQTRGIEDMIDQEVEATDSIVWQGPNENITC